MKLLKEFPRFFVGTLFIFSGIIKVNDPVGTAIKLEEYFEVFAYDFAPFFEYFVPAALFLSVVLSVLEVVLGIALLLNYRVNITAWVLLVMIIFFTFLTFYSAYFNKVTDCGCFGDAIKLTPWESFIKDLILLVFVGIIFAFRKDYKPKLKGKSADLSILFSTAALVFLAVMAIRHLPFVDFRPYAVGNHLPTLMQPSGELKYEYVMEKDGKEYTFETYPSDEGYEFVEMNVLNPEVQPKITDLAIWNEEGEFTGELMEGAKLILISYNVEKSDKSNLDEIKQLFNQVERAETWVLTASGQTIYDRFKEEYNLDYPYFFADATVLKTMIRSNPGLMLLKDGLVLGKWHHNDVPEISEINRLLY